MVLCSFLTNHRNFSFSIGWPECLVDLKEYLFSHFVFFFERIRYPEIFSFCLECSVPPHWLYSYCLVCQSSFSVFIPGPLDSRRKVTVVDQLQDLCLWLFLAGQPVSFRYNLFHLLSFSWIVLSLTSGF